MHGLLLLAGNGTPKVLLRPFDLDLSGGTNPEGKFDWFEVGGRFRDFLPLRTPRETRRFFGLLRGPLRQQAVTAQKSEVDVEALLKSPPAALLFAGQLSESPMMATGVGLQAWREEFACLLSAVPDDTCLTVIDFHRPIA